MNARRLHLTALAAACASLAVPAPAAAQPARTEQAVQSAAPDARLVRESFVRLHAPLPESAPPHPASCDWITYLRFRPAPTRARARRPARRRRGGRRSPPATSARQHPYHCRRSSAASTGANASTPATETGSTHTIMCSTRASA